MKFKFFILNHVRNLIVLIVIQIAVCNHLSAQELKLPGMAPTKWITFKNTQAPGRVYQSLNSNARTYTQEDTYFKIWIPVVVKSKFGLAIAPNYRSELLEMKGPQDDVADQLSQWKLRSIGADIKSFIQLDSSSWIINTGSISQSGNLNGVSAGSIPLTYSFSATYLKRKSINKEIGFGLMVNKTSSLMVLPVFVFNYNFSSRNGLEISLPHKIAWRHNLTDTDIFYVKAEANTRSYFINNAATNSFDLFRRIDVDMGVTYNKQFNRFMGAEIFAGYRYNLSNKLPADVVAVRNSGLALSFELYIRPPQGLWFVKKK